MFEKVVIDKADEDENSVLVLRKCWCLWYLVSFSPWSSCLPNGSILVTSTPLSLSLALAVSQAVCFQLCLQSHLNLQIHAHISDFPLTRWLHLNVPQVPQLSMFQVKRSSPKTPKPASAWIPVAPPSTPFLRSVTCAHFLHSIIHHIESASKTCDFTFLPNFWIYSLCSILPVSFLFCSPTPAHPFS